MATGSTLLALAGPVGWGIGGIALAGSGLYFNHKNKKVAREATEQRMAIEAQIRSLRTAEREIGGLRRQSDTHIAGCLADLTELIADTPTDYQDFSREQKLRMASLINHARAMSELIKKEIAL